MRCPTSAQNSLSRNPLARFVCFQLSLLLPLPLPLPLPHPFLPFKSFFSLFPSLPLPLLSLLPTLTLRLIHYCVLMTV